LKMSAIPHKVLSSGQRVKVVGLGTWKSTNEEICKAVEFAIDAGYRHFDCAWEYGNEAGVGEAIQKKIEDETVKREDLFITSKLWNDHHEPQHVRAAFMESLGRLKLKYLDLYLMHFPTGYKKEKAADGNDIYSDVDYLTTWKEMEKLVSDGLVRSLGVSNFNKFQLSRLLAAKGCLQRPVMNQIEVHPYLTSCDLVEFCAEKNVAVTAFSPFASPDRPWAPEGEKRLMDDPALEEIGKKMKKTPAQVVLRYLMQRGLIVIPKSLNPDHIKSNLEVCDFELDSEQMKAISNLNKNFRALALEYDLPHKYYPWKNDYVENE